MADSNVYQRLLNVQKAAHAPREISGKFGKARSAEQILEAYKPICNEQGLYLYTSDEMVQVGDRNYVTATATVVDIATKDSHSATASAWENVVEKSSSGNAILDTSQVTGKTSSYAKKYALQNLFAIDDTKDADQDDAPKPTLAGRPAPKPQPAAPAKPAEQPITVPPIGTEITDAQLKRMMAHFNEMGVSDREERLAYVTAIVRRTIVSSKELTRGEAVKVIDKQLHDLGGGE